MVIITVTGSKGGPGKSTFAIHLAVEWTLRGRRVLLADADPQGTSIKWGEARAALGRNKPTVIPCGNNVREAIADLAPAFDIVIIDTAGRKSQRLVAALGISDFALIPCPPSGPDLWELPDAIEIVRDVQEIHPELRAGIVANIVSARSKLSKQALAALHDFGLPVIAEMKHRAAIGEATTAGEGVSEREPRADATRELRALADAVESFLGMKESANVASA